MQEGKIKWFNTEKGYGFIEPSEGSRDVFVHISALDGVEGHQVKEGMSVKFDIVEVKGKSQASNVKKA